MSSRLLTDVFMLRCDRVSASTSRGETPSFSCSRAGIALEPDHSKAGSVTDEEEDCSAAWRGVSGKNHQYSCSDKISIIV